MSRTATRWLPLSILGVLVALVAGLVAVTGALASPATVGISSATVAPGDDATVTLSVTPASGEQVGTVTVDITYDAGITPKSCTNKAAALAVCNTAFGEHVVRYALASTDPVTGSLAELVFSTDQAGVFDLTLAIVQCSDPAGAAVSCTASNGKITVAEPTPTPSPSPSPVPATAAPTNTPAPSALPQTGGPVSDGSSSSLAWLVGSLGLAVLAAGVWAVSRTRRQSL